MYIINKDISLKEAMEISNYQHYLLNRRENGLLLSDYQISILNRNGINYTSYNNIRDLLFEIENILDDFYDDDLDLVSSQLYEYIYYNETKK